VPNFKRNVGYFGRAASEARYMVERSDWKGASQLQVRPSDFAYVDAVTHFARALGAARSGNIETAKADTAKLAELRDKLRAANDAYWSGQVDIQLQVANAWTLYAGGKHAEALEALAAAADAEDRTDKHPITPGPLAPARELYGVMLLDRGMAQEALVAFEATLKKEPNRLAAYVGAAKAAKVARMPIKVKQYTGKVSALTREADTKRPEVLELTNPRTAAAGVR
jgi:tetratricopeptide (TPR) repeat protein